MVGGQLAIPKDLVQQTEADVLAGVSGHNRAPAVFMTEEVMTAFDAENRETGLSESGNELLTGDAGCPAHAAMVTRWMPMNSRSCSGVPWT